MKKLTYVLLAMVTLLIINQKTYAQTGRNQEILKAVSDYFFLERENIHAHFDKNVFMTNENIWFKGYIFHRRLNVPFFATINVYANLIDSEGKIIDSKLLYGNIGSFSGNFKLGQNFKSGKYYVQFYTNWMNNFTEDESAIYEVTVVNPTTGAGNALAKADPSKINIEFTPEGGTLLSETANSIGVHVSDCNHNAMAVSSIDITDASGKVIKKVQLNKLGYGRFDLPAENTQGYKGIVTIEDKKHEQPLPASQLKGIALEVNNYAVADKTIIKVRTNKSTAESLGARPVYILIHQDEKATVMELTLSTTNLEQTLALPNTDFVNGMNTIRILDSDLKQLAERMFYKYPKTVLTTELSKKSQNADQLLYQGKVNYPNMNLSISVLPENTICLDNTNDIYGSFLLLPYLDNNKKASGRHYFTTLTKAKHYELDLYLLNQKSKYKWVNIMQYPAKDIYKFDTGITIKGTIPASIDSRLSRVRLYSLTSGIDEIAEVNEKREFQFENLIISDSSYVNFTLLKRGSEPKELTLAPQTLNVNKKFNKPYMPPVYCYAPIEKGLDITNPNIFEENVTELDELKIEGSKLRYANSFGNGNLHGYKITDENANNYQRLTDFIKTYGGFLVEDKGGELRIYSRTVTTINGQHAGPIIYIDNVQVVDYSMLTLIQMSEVDEVYMSSTAIVPSSRNYQGMIKIYLKKGANPGRKSYTPEIIIKNSFEKMPVFTNVTYNSVDDKGFENFGIIDWESNIMTDENGEFHLSIPKMSSKPMKILIEGFSADGKLISEIKTLSN